MLSRDKKRRGLARVVVLVLRLIVFRPDTSKVGLDPRTIYWNPQPSNTYVLLIIPHLLRWRRNESSFHKQRSGTTRLYCSPGRMLSLNTR